MTKPPTRRQRSAGLLVYRRAKTGVEFLLAHPGGPFWKHKDAGAWTIPKGLVDDGEDEFAAALREFREETGLAVDGAATPLSELRQKGGKTVMAWMLEADLDLAGFHSNTFELEWPPRSGRRASFPECDRAAYFAADEALVKILEGQRGFIVEAVQRLGGG